MISKRGLILSKIYGKGEKNERTFKKVLAAVLTLQ